MYGFHRLEEDIMKGFQSSTFLWVGWKDSCHQSYIIYKGMEYI